MVNEPFIVESRPLWKFRTLMNHNINEALEKMMLTDTAEGTITGKIEITLNKTVDEETGEVIHTPLVKFEVGYDVPVKRKDKDCMDEEVILHRGKDGRLKLSDNQISMEDLAAEE